MKAGLVGLGDMGFGMAKNLIQAKFEVAGYDVNRQRLDRLKQIGGIAAESVFEVGSQCKVVFIMVLNAEQAKAVALGENGLAFCLSPGSVVVITATIGQAAVLEIADELEKRGIALVDSPVSGGQSGAEAGELTLMSSGSRQALAKCEPMFKAVAKNINIVGERPGAGQTVKHALSGLTGACYLGIFEALVLAQKAGLDLEAFYKVVCASTVGNYIFKDSARRIIDRHFKDTGAGIGTMSKDIGLTLDFAQKTGVSMPLTSVAHQLFQAGKNAFPDEDNWCVVKILEQMAGKKN